MVLFTFEVLVEILDPVYGLNLDLLLSRALCWKSILYARAFLAFLALLLSAAPRGRLRFSASTIGPWPRKSFWPRTQRWPVSSADS